MEISVFVLNKTSDGALQLGMNHKNIRFIGGKRRIWKESDIGCICRETWKETDKTELENIRFYAELRNPYRPNHIVRLYEADFVGEPKGPSSEITALLTLKDPEKYDLSPLARYIVFELRNRKYF